MHIPNQCQLDLFSSVLHAYSANNEGILDNKSLYKQVVDHSNLPHELLSVKHPVGGSGQTHNLLARKLRWYQQTLKHAGIIQRIEGKRGVWQLTKPASKDLHEINSGVSVVGFSTKLGIAILGACETVFSKIDAPITLVVTSPPYPLAKQRNYGNPKESEYVDWICQTLEPVVKNLIQGGSICLNVSNDIFLSGTPARSLYRERLVLALNERLGLYKMDELIWENPSKPPGPIQWASINRFQLNVAWEPVYWLTNDPKEIRSNNKRVLQPHTEQHLKLIKQGGEKRLASYSDGAYSIKPGSFSNQTEGSIPKNILTHSHNCASQREYKRLARETNIPTHGATMPLSLASFLIEFLSTPNELVVDPFGGSFTTALAAERLGRRWLSTEKMVEYVLGGANRFRNFDHFAQHIAA